MNETTTQTAIIIHRHYPFANAATNEAYNEVENWLLYWNWKNENRLYRQRQLAMREEFEAANDEVRP